MKLYYSPTSPFVRKVIVLAMETGLDKQLERITTNPWQAEDILTTENPLSKVPTLVRDNKEAIFDSAVICEYLDSLHSGNKLIPLQGEARWKALRLQALVDGMLDAGILHFLEQKRVAEQQSPDWVALQQKTIERGLDYLEKTVSGWSDKLDIGVISVACLLGWLDFRFPAENWRSRCPNLHSWFESFSKRDSMLNTTPAELK